MFYKSECMWVASCKIACKENLMPFIHVSRILHFMYRVCIWNCANIKQLKIKENCMVYIGKRCFQYLCYLQITFILPCLISKEKKCKMFFLKTRLLSFFLLVASSAQNLWSAKERKSSSKFVNIKNTGHKTRKRCRLSRSPNKISVLLFFFIKNVSMKINKPQISK